MPKMGEFSLAQLSEADDAKLKEYLGHSPGRIKIHELRFIVRSFAKKLGYTFE